MSFQPGQTYTWVNVKAGTVADLSGDDNRVRVLSVIGYERTGQSNQRWTIESVEGKFRIRNNSTGSYLAIDGSPQNGTPVIVTSNDNSTWDIYPDEYDSSAFRIFVSDTPFNLDLDDNGNPAPGTRIQLWEKNSGRGQIWRFEQ